MSVAARHGSSAETWIRTAEPLSRKIVVRAIMFAVRAFLVPLLLGLASVASASIFGPDDRLVIGHSRGTPFAPIGVAYDPASNLYGTAILVDECHVLTAEH